MKSNIKKNGKDFTHIKVLVYSEPKVNSEIPLLCKSTSCNCGLTVSPILNVPLNELFFSFLKRTFQNIISTFLFQFVIQRLIIKSKLTFAVFVVS